MPLRLAWDSLKPVQEREPGVVLAKGPDKALQNTAHQVLHGTTLDER